MTSPSALLCERHARFSSTFKAVSVRQARVALDHFFSDVQLIAETLDAFDPSLQQERKDALGKAVDAGLKDIGMKSSTLADLEVGQT